MFEQNSVTFKCSGIKFLKFDDISLKGTVLILYKQKLLWHV